MNSAKLKKSRKNKGFTLIELVVVIAVIGILAAVAVPIIGNVVGDAKASADKAQQALFQSAVERSAAENDGTYPATNTDVRAAINKYTNVTSTIPNPKQSGYNFYWNKTTHKVELSKTAPADTDNGGIINNETPATT